MKNPLVSPADYSAFIYALPDRYPVIGYSSLVYVSLGITIGKVKGILSFADSIILCVQEFLNFGLQVIEGYGYEVSRARIPVEELPRQEEYCRASYPHKEKLWWYDSFPHPTDVTLAMNHPHHKHIPPDIKHHRIPAPSLSFTMPNLPFLIEEIQRTLLQYSS